MRFLRRWRWSFAMLLILGCPVTALAHPGSAIAVGRDGRVYFVDTGRGVFEIGRDGRLKRHDAPAFHWFALDETSRSAKMTWPSISGAEIRSVGLDPTLVLSSDFPVAIGPDGGLYYPELGPRGRFRIVRVAASGARSVHAALPEEATHDGEPSWINGLAFGTDGSLYYTQDRTLRRITKRGDVATVAAGVTVPACVSIPGIGPPERPYLRGLGVAPDGTVFVAAAGCGAVLRITPAGRVTPILRTVAPYSPTAVAVWNGEVYVLEYLHTASDERREWFARVRKVARDGTVATLADTARDLNR